METATTLFQAVARELNGAFVQGERTDGERFWKLRDDAPEWIDAAELAHSCHVAIDGRDPRFPSDYVYGVMAHAAAFAVDYDDADDARDAIGDFADGETDSYNATLFQWVSHPRNMALADEAAEEYGVTLEPREIDGGEFSSAVRRWAQRGQYLAAERIAAAIVDAIETEAATRGE